MFVDVIGLAINVKYHWVHVQIIHVVQMRNVECLKQVIIHKIMFVFVIINKHMVEIANRVIDYSEKWIIYFFECLAVPNPCLTNLQQFHPFAFSRRAYINCDDELIFFQPCNANLYWNQENKRCDRSLPLLLRAPFLNLRNTQWQSKIVKLSCSMQSPLSFS